jgi:hypothetical protein
MKHCWPTYGSTSNHQTGCTCGLEACYGGGRIDHIAIGDDWYVNGFYDIANLLPVGLAGVSLAQCAAVHADSLDALSLQPLRNL